MQLEQVLAWDPDTIVTWDDASTDAVRTDPAWAGVAAVKHGRVYLSPGLPFGWIDRPPSLNRLIGLRWLAGVFYPDQAPRLAGGDAGVLPSVLSGRARRARAGPPARTGRRQGSLTHARGAVLVPGLLAALAAIAVVALLTGPYPAGPGDIARALWRRLAGGARRRRRRHRPVRRPPAADRRRAPGRRGARRRRRRLPEPVPQPPGLARHPGRLRRRRPGRGARHLPVPARARHPAPGVRRRPRHRGAGLARGRRRAWPRARPGPGAGRRRRGRPRRLDDLAAQGAGRPLRPAAGDHLLAAGQPRRHHRRPTSRGAVPAVLLGLAPLLLLRWRIDVLALGDEEARALGVEAGRLRRLVVAAATLVTAAVVAISGQIGWVGLIVPHIARILVGPGFARLLPTAMLLGAGYLLAGRHRRPAAWARSRRRWVSSRRWWAPLFFLWLLARGRTGWAMRLEAIGPRLRLSRPSRSAATSTCRWALARSCACSAPTARARPRCSARCWA